MHPAPDATCMSAVPPPPLGCHKQDRLGGSTFRSTFSYGCRSYEEEDICMSYEEEDTCLVG